MQAEQLGAEDAVPEPPRKRQRKELAPEDDEEVKSPAANRTAARVPSGISADQASASRVKGDALMRDSTSPLRNQLEQLAVESNRTSSGPNVIHNVAEPYNLGGLTKSPVAGIAGQSNRQRRNAGKSPFK